MKNNQLLCAGILALGLTLAGWFVYAGIRKVADNNRAVTVKGLSTRDVHADHVVWPLRFTVHGNNLPAAYAELSRVQKTVTQFFVEKGFAESDLSTGDISVDDQWASYYGHKPEYRYALTTSLVLSTDQVERVVQNRGCQGELLSKGIILSSDEWNVDYQYNSLNELKPEMIEEATKNARAVAQKFADDSNSRLGGIRCANQGQFSVDGDRYQPWIKHVRVVTTVDFYLN